MEILQRPAPASAYQTDNKLPPGSPDMVVVLATARAGEAALRSAWQSLVESGNSPQKIYQTPAFFTYLQQSSTAGERLELVMLLRLSDGAILGVVPVRIQRHTLRFGLGPLTLCAPGVEVISLLGSVPAAPAGSAVASYLARQMLAMFPSPHAVYMQALPAASRHWQDLAQLDGLLGTTLLGSWRRCHTLPLPDSFAQYLEKFSAKKRYNLNRQLRQLAGQAGTLTLERVDRPTQVADMMLALSSLVLSDEQKAILSETSLCRLAAQQLLLCYVLRAGGQVLAAVLATRSPDTLHVHNIFVGRNYVALSVGTSVMHLVIEDLTAMACFKSVDFGYGTPNHDFRSSHVAETRGQVLLYDRARSISLLFFLHRHFCAASEGALAALKCVRRLARALRHARPA